MANGWLSVTCSDVLKGYGRLPYFLALAPKSSKKGFRLSILLNAIIPPTPLSVGLYTADYDPLIPLHVRESGSVRRAFDFGKAS